MAGSAGAAHGVEGRRAGSGGWVGWILLTALAELFGILLGASWWVWADGLMPEPNGLFWQISMLLFKALSGVPEGIVLGLVQANLMSRRLPDLSIVRWTMATCVVAMVGWAAGSSFSIFATGQGGVGAFEPSVGETILMAAGFGLTVGALFGGVQTLALGGLGVKRWPWIAGNAVGWSLGLPAIYLAASGWALGPVWALAAIGGVVAGGVVGVSTAVAFAFMTREG
ncbi:hypothetical protein B7G68_14200 [Caulobacter segnis]|uniref:Uncharacterized protein n=2 Tax=Caulobacter segnis TaxID=88688 RepID=D5VL51_CAUST|nr:hypothetical protein [Caulobacter segnis]ADG11224.1 conserved hypothetical protein [Caulobacter segnis ATCC 21756]AVQ02904.1 hypothetical protein B7G68_14200 [Caulobacter segnis]